ncbi:MAG TPA: hypothetical protein VIH69_06205 [Dehalococcoidia bacterium]
MEKELFLILTGFGLGVFGSAGLFIAAWRKVRTRRLAPPPPPAPPEESIIIVRCEIDESTAPGYTRGQFLDLPLPWDRMVRLAQTIIKRGYSFNHGLTSREAGNPLTRGEYEAVRELFESRGLIRERTPGVRRSGFVVTSPGKAFIRMWADLPPYSQQELRAYIDEQRHAQEHAEERVREDTYADKERIDG